MLYEMYNIYDKIREDTTLPIIAINEKDAKRIFGEYIAKIKTMNKTYDLNDYTLQKIGIISTTEHEKCKIYEKSEYISNGNEIWQEILKLSEKEEKL
jgi:hypothetical protein